MPWYIKLGCVVGLAWCCVRFTAGIVEQKNMLDPTYYAMVSGHLTVRHRSWVGSRIIITCTKSRRTKTKTPPLLPCGQPRREYFYDAHKKRAC